MVLVHQWTSQRQPQRLYPRKIVILSTNKIIIIINQYITMDLLHASLIFDAYGKYNFL